MKFLKFDWYDNTRFLYQWGMRYKNGESEFIARPNYHDPYWDNFEDSNYIHLSPTKPLILGNFDCDGRYCCMNLKTFNYKIGSEETFYKRLGLGSE